MEHLMSRTFRNRHDRGDISWAKSPHYTLKDRHHRDGFLCWAKGPVNRSVKEHDHWFTRCQWKTFLLNDDYDAVAYPVKNRHLAWFYD